MSNKKIAIALVSPSQNAYSETFIQQHKERLNGNIFYYYNGYLPDKLEGGLLLNSRKSRIVHIIKGHYRLNEFSLEQMVLIESFKKNNIQVVFAEYGPTGEELVKVCEFLKIPLLVHFHGIDASSTEIVQSYSSYRGIFNYASYIIAVSKEMYRDLKELGCPEEKLVYNVYGPREEFLKVRPKFLNDQFLFAGRFVNKKAPYNLVLAMKKVTEKYPTAKLMMAGDGDLLESCKRLSTHLELSQNIIFPGIQSLKQLLDHMENSIAYVQHSVETDNGDKEGTPLAILEANAAGLPVISTEHAGIPDVVSHNFNGMLCKEHDIMKTADFMIELLKNKEKARIMGEKGRETIKTSFSLSKHINNLNDLINNALKEGS